MNDPSVMRRTTDALESFVEKLPTDAQAAALLAELIRKINADAQGYEWDSPLADDDQEKVEALERQLFFVTAGKPKPMFVSIDLILASIAVDGTFADKRTQALTLELIDTVREQIESYLRGNR